MPMPPRPISRTISYGPIAVATPLIFREGGALSPGSRGPSLLGALAQLAPQGLALRPRRRPAEPLGERVDLGERLRQLALVDEREGLRPHLLERLRGEVLERAPRGGRVSVRARRHARPWSHR